MQVFISSGPDWHAINDENYDDFSGMGYKPLLWYGGNVYVGNDFQTHDLLCKEFGIKWDDWDDRPEEGMLFNEYGADRIHRAPGIEWRGQPEPAPGVNDAIYEALGMPRTFMSSWNDRMKANVN